MRARFHDIVGGQSILCPNREPAAVARMKWGYRARVSAVRNRCAGYGSAGLPTGVLR